MADPDVFMRDFNRYTGDGLPNEPVGAPLPIGDPASGAKVPTKKDLRDWADSIQLNTEAGTLLGGRIDAEAAARISADASERIARIAGDDAERLARIAGDEAAASGEYYAGIWDASTGAFPVVRQLGGTVNNGDYFVVSVAGIVGGVSFNADDRIRALRDNPSSTTLAGNWTHTPVSPLLGGLVPGIFLSRYGLVDGYSGGLNTAIAAAKAEGHRVGYLQPGTYNLTSLSEWDNFEIRGSGQGQTILDITGAPDGYALTLNTRAVVSDLTIQGPLVETDITTPASPWFTTIDQAVAFNKIGGVHAIKKTADLSNVRRVEFLGVEGWCVENGRTNISSLFGNASGVTECRMHNNYGGIFDPSAPDLAANLGAEYLHHNGNTINQNVIGVAVRGGNNTFAQNKIDHNVVGFMVLGGHNDSHGSVTGGSINHSAFATVIADKCGQGELFTGVSMFDGGTWGIYLRKSRGVRISAGAASKMNIFAEGVYEGNAIDTSPTGPGVNVIHDMHFLNHGVNFNVNRNYNGSTDNLLMHDNINLEGSTYTQDTTWDEDILNTNPIDRFGWSKTAKNGIASISGRPIDAFAGIGTGTQTGALRIKLPSGFGNTLVSLRVRSLATSTSRENIDYTIQGYALTSGQSWTATYAQKTGENLPVRFGSDPVDNLPVIYIGELTSTWADAVFEITEFAAHKSVLAAKKYFVSGWDLSLEATAFNNVTRTIQGFEYNGDLNVINYNADHYVASTSTNKPGSLAGWLTSMVRQPASGIRMQSYVDTAADAWTRVTNGGDAAWGAWKKHTP